MKKEAILTMNRIQRLTSRTEKLILLLSGFFLLGLVQEVHAGFDLGADVVSRYIWRGNDFGNSASVQPYVSYSAGPVEVGAWSSWAVTAPGANENDLYVSASFGPVSVTMTDYYFPVTAGPANTGFFDYSQETGSHILEFGASYENGPFGLFAGYNFWGDDAQSLYVRGDYQFYEMDDYQASLSIGAGNGLYLTRSDSPDLVNVSLAVSKDIFTVSYILNPNAEISWMVFGVGFGPE